VQPATRWLPLPVLRRAVSNQSVLLQELAAEDGLAGEGWKAGKFRIANFGLRIERKQTGVSEQWAVSGEQISGQRSEVSGQRDRAVSSEQWAVGCGQ
jgi:hypothetical protein